MFSLNDSMCYYLSTDCIDMRKGINSLIGVVKERMGREVVNGDVFIFIGRSRRLMKLIHAEDGGMAMYVKRLESGRFRLPDYDPETKSFYMEWRDLVVMVEGGAEKLFRIAPPKKKALNHLYKLLIFTNFTLVNDT